MRLPRRPTVYEINTAVWLQRLGRERGRALALDEVPAAEWDALAALPVDAVWLMGVWQRSPAGLRIALDDPALDAANRAALPDLRPEDVIGSPYCVRDYVVDERFGGPAALAAAREQLAARGLGVILDYVPNHVAPDHPWTTARPECLLTGTEEDLARHPEAFLRTAGGVVAKGRDPYFAPWPDVAQLNAFAPALREAVAETLIAIAGQCDGLRCDMAMLMTNEVFARTWGERAGPAPQDEYWPTLIARTKAAHPDFLFIAEAYWDMEWTLQQQGFDLCYDKRLYDRLAHESAESVRGHLQADPGYQERLMRFIENHDEPRAAATFAAGPGEGGRGRHVHAAGRAPLPRRPARGPAHADPGLPRPGTRRAAGRRSACVLRAAAARRRRRRPARRRLAPVRLRGLARQRLPSPAGLVVLVEPRTHATSWSSTSPMPRRRRACACRGTTSRDAPGS